VKLFTTQLKAINPATGEISTFCGPHIPAISIEDAQDYCDNNGLGYCVVIGELVAEIPCKKDSNDADMKIIRDYQNINLN